MFKITQKTVIILSLELLLELTGLDTFADAITDSAERIKEKIELNLAFAIACSTERIAVEWMDC